MTYKPFTGTGTDFYVASDDAAEMVNLAIALERPILVEGEAGCGKTLLARAIATELGLGAPISISVKSTSRAKDLLYRFDALRRLQDSQGGDRLSRFQFWGTVADQIGIELTRDALWAVLEDGVTEPTGDLRLVRPRASCSCRDPQFDQASHCAVDLVLRPGRMAG